MSHPNVFKPINALKSIQQMNMVMIEKLIDGEKPKKGNISKKIQNVVLLMIKKGFSLNSCKDALTTSEKWKKKMSQAANTYFCLFHPLGITGWDCSSPPPFVLKAICTEDRIARI